MDKLIRVNDEPLPWEEKLNINRILELKNYTFKMLVIKVNGKLVKKDQYDKFFIPPGADIKVIHLISGG
ncbi:MAG: sulfur carrier protein ThiS [Candidatus Cloacimonetes bacterium]|nr:sulfur carrier protein ThiS [Candidatus Cloacimonadota bacterium]